MRNGFAAVVNLTTLVLGILIGFALARVPQTEAAAQQAQPQFEEVSPVMTAGSAAFGTLLAGRLAADEIAIQGIDLVKLHQNTLNLLGTKTALFTKAELESVIQKSRVPTPLRMKQPEKKP